MRTLFVWIHRWAGLAMALFLAVEGITGALIAFYPEIERVLVPARFASAPAPGSERLDPASLMERAERSIGPHGAVGYVLSTRQDQVVLVVAPKLDPASGRPYDLGYGRIVLDPWTGRTLARLDRRGYSDSLAANILPFAYELHVDLALGAAGPWILGIVALLWTFDTIWSAFLTLPARARAFWRRWIPAWKVRWHHGSYRLQYDLHRAGGLWLWPLYFVFAWSSVGFYDPSGLYGWSMAALFEARPFEEQLSELYPATPDRGAPALDWRAAQAAGEEAVRSAAARGGFRVMAPRSLQYFAYAGRYNYTVETDRPFPQDRLLTVFLDSNTGRATATLRTATGHAGETVGNWLRALHMVRDPVESLAYRTLVALVGLALVLLSFTGITIWWRKRSARRVVAGRRLAPPHRAPA
jgi:uncharacterized iron-regulated membrane protein